MLCGMKDEFGESLNGMGWIDGEVGVEILLDGREKRKQLWRKGARRERDAGNLGWRRLPGGYG